MASYRSKDGENFLQRIPMVGKIFRHPKALFTVQIVGVFSILALAFYLLLPYGAFYFVPVFYLYGAVPFPLVTVWLFRKKVLVEHGSGNISVSNAFREGGYAGGTLALGGEISKALLPLFVSWGMFGYDLVISTTLIFCCLIGTFFSPFAGFRGGHGVTMVIWTCIFLAPVPTLITVPVLLVIYYWLRDPYLVSVIAPWILALGMMLSNVGAPLILLLILYAILLTLRYSRAREEYQYGIKVGND